MRATRDSPRSSSKNSGTSRKVSIHQSRVGRESDVSVGVMREVGVRRLVVERIRKPNILLARRIMLLLLLWNAVGILVELVKLISIRSSLIVLGKMENGKLKRHISANRQLCTSKNHYLIMKIFMYGGSLRHTSTTSDIQWL